MKKLVLLFAILLSATTFAQTSFVRMDLPASMKAACSTTAETVTIDVIVKSKDGRTTQNGQIRFGVADKCEGLVSLELSQNIVTIGGITPVYFVQNDNQIQTLVANQSFSECIKDCNTRYTNADGTKIPGRGWCKAGCWVDVAVEVLQAVATISEATAK